ncbi:MAG: hypothetical protein JWP35_2525 [Caulobacter sp.]|nr:hypothetical protein [Caulobacter sp.]
MRALRVFLPILFAVLFAASGVARAAPPPSGGAPPCHMAMGMDAMADMTGGQHAPKRKPTPDMMAMSCCVACLATADALQCLSAPVGRTDSAPAPALLRAPEGRTPSLDPEPPRPLA